MELTEEFVRQSLAWHQRRVDAILAAGGIAAMDAIDGLAVVPDGWVLDYITDFWIQPNLDLTHLETKPQ